MKESLLELPGRTDSGRIRGIFRVIFPVLRGEI